MNVKLLDKNKLSEFLINLAIFAFAVILGLILMQEGSFYSIDCKKYTELVKHFINLDFSYKTAYSSGYSLIIFPLVYMLNKIGTSIEFAIRFINIVSFGLTSIAIYYLTRQIYNKRTAGILSSLMYCLGTFSIIMAIDVWSTNLSVLLGLLTIIFGIKFCQNQKIIYFILNAITTSLFFLIRPFEIITFLFLWIIMVILYFKNKKIKKELKLKQFFIYLLIFLFIFSIFLSPYIYYNKKVYNNYLEGGYGTKNDKGTDKLFSTSPLKTLPKIFFHFDIKREDKPVAFNPNLSIFEASPFLIVFIFSIFSNFRKKYLISISLIGFFIIFIFFYGTFNKWSSTWSPALRLFLPILPIMCIYSGITIIKFIRNIYCKKTVVISILYFLFVFIFLGRGLFSDFIDKIIFTNIGIRDRNELKMLGIILCFTFFMVYILYFVIKKLNISERLKDVYRGIVLTLFILTFLHSLNANLIAGAIGIRYGDNIYPFLNIDQLKYTNITFFENVPTIYYFIFYLFFLIIIFSLLLLIFMHKRKNSLIKLKQ